VIVVGGPIVVADGGTLLGVVVDGGVAVPVGGAAPGVEVCPAPGDPAGGAPAGVVCATNQLAQHSMAKNITARIFTKTSV
jgi:hypothetical protein